MRIAMGTTTKLITYEDSLTMPENRFEEIVHGESRIMPPPIKNHVYLIDEAVEYIARPTRQAGISCQRRGPAWVSNESP